LADYSESIKVQPNEVAYYNRGNIYLYNEGLFNEAVSDFKEGIKINPNYIDIYLSLATAYMSVGNTDGAMLICKKTLEINPNHKKAQELLAEVNKKINHNK